MSFQNLNTNSFCVRQKHYSDTKNSVGEITFKKTGREIISKVGPYSICKKKKSLIVSDNTIVAEGSTHFFKSLGKKDLMN